MSGFIGVNVGSSYQVVDGWLSLDHSKHILIARIPGLARTLNQIGVMPVGMWPHHRSGAWRRVRFWDARMPLPLRPESVQYAYSSHTLEHFLPNRALAVVRDVLRVLQRGGLFRVVLPDLEQVATAYTALQANATCVFRDRRISRAEWADAASQFCFAATSRHEACFGHHWMYDRHSARTLLLHAGFSVVHDREFRKGAVPDLDRLDMPERQHESFYIEGVK